MTNIMRRDFVSIKKGNGHMFNLLNSINYLIKGHAWSEAPKFKIQVQDYESDYL